MRAIIGSQKSRGFEIAGTPRAAHEFRVLHRKNIGRAHLQRLLRICNMWQNFIFPASRDS
jgi:hypothetical protein